MNFHLQLGRHRSCSGMPGRQRSGVVVCAEVRACPIPLLQRRIRSWTAPKPPPQNSKLKEKYWSMTTESGEMFAPRLSFVGDCVSRGNNDQTERFIQDGILGRWPRSCSYGDLIASIQPAYDRIAIKSWYTRKTTDCRSSDKSRRRTSSAVMASRNG